VGRVNPSISMLIAGHLAGHPAPERERFLESALKWYAGVALRESDFRPSPEKLR